mmetsp:Transcript_28903/g.89335  ORF Transcript_28903/g.89335 Transcript_28903/m.89335 type:complete len:647 (+) Transcript_28903:776-2716(+)
MRRAQDGKWSATASTSTSPQAISARAPDELTAIIKRLTETLAGDRCGLSNDAIIVRLTSPEAPNLTLVDLPGIVRTAVSGQDSEAIGKVNQLIDSYITKKHSIILAVVPSDQDIATIDILERARKVDPDGERTLGVLTKPDILEPGKNEEVVAVLKNLRKPLKLGFVMVKNRSQYQIQQGISLESALKIEEDFFLSHPVFSRLDPRLLGVRSLVTSLAKLLVTRIQQQLAPMKRQVEMTLSKIRGDIRAISSYGTAASASERQKLLVTLTQEFVRHLNDCVRGEYRDRLIVCNPNLRLYTRALVVFQELQSRVMSTAPHFRSNDFVTNLANQMEALRGRELPGFMSAQSFYMFIQEFIDAWAAPARMAAAQMRALAGEVVQGLFQKVAISYPVLRDSLGAIASSILEESENQALQLLDGLVVREKDPFTINEFLQAHINKLRYDRFEKCIDAAFYGTTAGAGEVASWQATKEHVGASLRSWYQSAHGVSSSANAEDMSAILEAYWTLASKRFIDSACMCVDDRILGTLCAKLQEKCYHFVHDEGKLAAFFTEDATLVARRVHLENSRDRLVAANAAMASIQMTRKVLRGPLSGCFSFNAKLLCSEGESAEILCLLEGTSKGLGLQLADEAGVVRFNANIDASGNTV